jgi:diguanylate cyclase (GGDEF)-like protein
MFALSLPFFSLHLPAFLLALAPGFGLSHLVLGVANLGHGVTALACFALPVTFALHYRRASDCTRPVLAWIAACLMALGSGQLAEAVSMAPAPPLLETVWVWLVAAICTVTAWQLCRNAPEWLDTRRELIQVRAIATQDPLTGLQNRQGFNRAFDRALATARAGLGQSTLALFDLDGFKQANDQYGHLIGDRILQRVAEILQAHSRKSDCVARLGGDEFAVLWTNCSAIEAQPLVEAIRREIAQVHVEGTPLTARPVTSSIGMAEVDPKLSAEGNYELTDRFLYESKRLGKNQVCWFAKRAGQGCGGAIADPLLYPQQGQRVAELEMA